MMAMIMRTILQMTAYVSVMILGILTLRAVFQHRLSIKIIMLLWALVMIRMVLPITLDAPVHILNVFPERVAETRPVAMHDAPLDGDADVERKQTQMDTSLVPVQTEMDDTEVGMEHPPETAAAYGFFQGIYRDIKALSLMEMMFFIWAVGAAAVLARNVIWALRFMHKIRSRRFISNNTVAQKVYVDCHKLGIGKSVSVFECDCIDSPITCGIFRPKILLPTAMIETIGVTKAELIIFHELIHIKKYDVLKNYIWMLAKIIHWFNPLVYFGYHAYSEDIELNCDEVVKTKHSSAEVLEYSQGIIDVVKLSKGTRNLPTAIPFSKNKIRKRVETMLRPKAKKKFAAISALVIAVMMVVGCFTTACTKDVEVNEPPQRIQSEQTNEAVTDMGQETATQETVDAASETVNAFDYWNNEADTITIDISAEVTLPGLSKIPVAILEPREITSEMVEQIGSAFFGDLVVYSGSGMTKAMYEEAIQRVEAHATDMNSDMADASGAKNLEELRKVADIQIEKLQKGMKDAPDTLPLADYGDVDQSNMFTGRVYLGDEKWGHVSASKSSRSTKDITCDAYNGTTWTFDPIESMPVDIGSAGEDYLNAKEIAEKKIADMGIEGVGLSAAYLLEDLVWYTASDDAPRELVGSDGYFYIIVFTREVGQGNVAFHFCRGEAFNPYEQIVVWVKEDRVERFFWTSPMQLKAITDERDRVDVDYPAAIEVLKQNAELLMDKARQAYIDHNNITVDRIVFELVSTYGDDGERIIVPAWSFYGAVHGRLSEEGGNIFEEYDAGEYIQTNKVYSNADYLISVNALNGEIINLDKSGS